MKRAYFAAAFLAAVLLGCGISLFALGEGVRQVRGSISAAYHAAEKENGLAEAVEKIDAEWNRRHALFRFVLGSDSCFQFESILDQVKARSAIEKAKSPELFSELSSLSNCIGQEWETQLITLENLF